MAYFGTIVESDPDELDEDGLLSPDGRSFIKITHRGNVERGEREGTLWLFDSAAALAAIANPKAARPSPIALVRFSASAQGISFDNADEGNVLFQPRWSVDGKSLMFLGRDRSECRRVYRFDLQSKRLEAVTPADQDVLSYSLSAGRVAYMVAPSMSAADRWQAGGPDVPDIVAGTGTSLIPLLFPRSNAEAYFRPVMLSVWIVDHGKAMPVLDPRGGGALSLISGFRVAHIELSPDGFQALVVAAVLQGEPPKGMVDEVPLTYWVIDLRNGSLANLLKTPIRPFEYHQVGRFRTAWSARGDRVAITEVSAPGAGTSKTSSCVIAIVRVKDGELQCALAGSVHDKQFIHSVRWLGDDRVLARFKTDRSNSMSSLLVRRAGSAWKTGPVPTSLQPAVELSVREALNDPPVLVGTDRSGRSRVIYDPNPQLAEVELTRVTPYQWQDPHGRTMTGLLLLPVGYVPGNAYPLVIQTHGFDAQRFFRVGYGETACVGRPIGGRGIILLQTQERSGAWGDTWQDSTENGDKVYVSAIDKLAADGLVDRNKVGITGYSFTGPFVARTISRSPDRYAAAAISNTDPGTLIGHFTYVDTDPDNSKAFADMIAGAQAYGPDLQMWLMRAPAFASDKVTAPVLFSAGDPWHLIEMWQFYASLREQGKPVDLQYIRGGQHNFRKVTHVYAHQEMMLDWFDFWLNGHEDPDVHKAPQYARWRALKASRPPRIEARPSG